MDVFNGVDSEHRHCHRYLVSYTSKTWNNLKITTMIINGEYVETIFDHNLTESEMIAVLGSDDWKSSDFSDWSQINHYGLLYRLYTYRGKQSIAKKYADKIPNTERKVFGCCYHDFAVSRY